MRTEIDTSDACITNKRLVTLIARAMSARISFSFPFFSFSFYLSLLFLHGCRQDGERKRVSLVALELPCIPYFVLRVCRVSFDMSIERRDALTRTTHASHRALSLARRCKVQRGRNALVIGVLLQWERRFCSYNSFDRSSRVRSRVPFSFDRF